MVATTDYAAARFHMVEGQIRPNRVTDPRLVAALREIPREQFVPKPMRGIAYVDEDLAIGGGRYLMEPMVLARLLQEAEIGPEDVVLDIGCATGYSAAVMARLATTVVAVESDPELAARATETLAALGLDNAVVVQSALTEGYPAQAPYDVILIDGAVSEVPRHLLEQLTEGGRLVTVVAPPRAVSQARLYTRFGDTFPSRVLFDANTRLLPGFEPKPRFEF